jgi:formate hydrogenlyase transcriptional activator
VILSSGPVLRVGLPQSKQLVVIGKGTLCKQETLEQAVRNHILAALEDTDWVVAGPNGAAARLGINRSTLQFRMHKLGLFRGRIHLGEVRP